MPLTIVLTVGVAAVVFGAGELVSTATNSGGAGRIAMVVTWLAANVLLIHYAFPRPRPWTLYVALSVLVAVVATALLIYNLLTKQRWIKAGLEPPTRASRPALG